MYDLVIYYDGRVLATVPFHSNDVAAEDMALGWLSSFPDDIVMLVDRED